MYAQWDEVNIFWKKKKKIDFYICMGTAEGRLWYLSGTNVIPVNGPVNWIEEKLIFFLNEYFILFIIKIIYITIVLFYLPGGYRL